MKKYSVNELVPRMFFTEDSFVDEHNIYKRKNEIITPVDIAKLKEWGFNYVLSDGEIQIKDTAPVKKPSIIKSSGKNFETTAKSANTAKEIKRKAQELKSQTTATTNNSSSTTVQKQNNTNTNSTKNQEKNNEYEIPKSVLTPLNAELCKFHDQLKAYLVNLLKSVQNGEKINVPVLNNVIGKVVEKVRHHKSSLNLIINRYDKGSYLLSHSVNVCILSLIIGTEMKITGQRLLNLGIGALLFDIGLVKLPASLVNKQGKLTEEEYLKMKAHPLLGSQILKKQGGFTEEVTNIALQHHERYDGNGYPSNLTGQHISEFAKIVSIANSYDGMVNPKSFSGGMSKHEAMIKLTTGQEQYNFDSQFLNAFIRVMGIYPVGSFIKLNNGIICEVVANERRNSRRPLVQMILDPQWQVLDKIVNLKLAEHHEFKVQEALDETKIKFID